MSKQPYSTEAQANEQWRDMKVMQADLLDFKETLPLAIPARNKHLADVLNVNDAKIPQWWSNSLLPEIVAYLQGMKQPEAPVVALVAPTTEEKFSVILLRNGSVVTTFDYKNVSDAIGWATSVFRQNTGLTTDKFTNNNMPVDSDWWSITAKHEQTKVCVQLTKNIVPVQV